MLNKIKFLGLAAVLVAGPALADHHNEKMKTDDHIMLEKSFDLMDTKGNKNGTVKMTEGASGLVIHASLSDLNPGEHAIHIHETGDCSPHGEMTDDQTPFKNAGGHFNPDESSHGIFSENGPHAGDLPNFFASQDGTAKIEMISKAVTLKKDAKHSLFDADGSAIIVHQGSDDYTSQPSGDAGSRVACAAIK